MRALAKTLVERGIVATGLAGWLARRMRSASLVLAYHNIRPLGDPPSGDRSLHLGQREFATQLDLLERLVDVVSLQDLMQDHVASQRPRVAITFDDAYHGAVTAGVHELRKRGLPATIFVPPGCLGGHSFWWDAVSASDGLQDDVRRFALEVCAGRGQEVRKWARLSGRSLGEVGKFALSATLHELEDALDYRGLSLGSHTWGHPNLTRVSDLELTNELSQSFEWLKLHFGSRTGPWLTYPYGLTDSRVERATKSASYSAAFCVDGGWMPAVVSNPFRLPRLNVPAGVTPDGFRLRLAGLFCD